MRRQSTEVSDAGLYEQTTLGALQPGDWAFLRPTLEIQVVQVDQLEDDSVIVRTAVGNFVGGATDSVRRRVG